MLVQVPRSTNPNPKPAIAFDQCLQNRLAELGLDEAELVSRYTTHLQADRNRSRSIPIKALRGESDPTLATVFAILHPEVLDGELLIQWEGDQIRVVSDPEAVSDALKARMIQLGLNPASTNDLIEVSRRYILVRFGGPERGPWNCIKTIQQMIEDHPNPRLQTFNQLVQALGGQVLIRWQLTIRKRLPADKLPPDLLEISGARPAILEYQELSAPVVLSSQ